MKLKKYQIIWKVLANSKDNQIIRVVPVEVVNVSSGKATLSDMQIIPRDWGQSPTYVHGRSKNNWVYYSVVRSKTH